MANVFVDTKGNLYVTDVGKKVVDEFDSTGTFVRAFPAPRAEQGYPGVGGAGVDPTNGNVLIDESIYNEEGKGGVSEFDSSGNFLGAIKYTKETSTFQSEAAPAVNSHGYVYVPTGANVDIFGPAGVVPSVTYKPVSNPSTTAGTLNAAIDPQSRWRSHRMRIPVRNHHLVRAAAPCPASPQRILQVPRTLAPCCPASQPKRRITTESWSTMRAASSTAKIRSIPRMT